MGEKAITHLALVEAWGAWEWVCKHDTVVQILVPSPAVYSCDTRN